MVYVAKIPKLRLKMRPGELLTWLVSGGDEVTEGDPVVEIESEKTTAEINTKENGVLWRVVLIEDESIMPGGMLAIVAGTGENISGLEVDASAGEGGSEPIAIDGSAGDSSPIEVTETAETAATDGGDASSVIWPHSRGSDGTPENSEVRASPRAKRLVDNLGIGLTVVEGTGLQGAITESDVEITAEPAAAAVVEKHVFIPPSIRHLACELGVDIEAVGGTGQNGRITESDAWAASGAAVVATDSSTARAAMTAATDATAANRLAKMEWPLSGIYRIIVDCPGKNYRETIHITVDRRADAEELLAAANAAVDVLDVDVPIMDVLFLTPSASLDEYSESGATFKDDVRRFHEKHNVCVAVDVDEGLIAPIVRDMVSLSPSELAGTRVETAQRALSGDFMTDDLSGEMSIVPNFGVLGVKSFDPIVNPPQVVILDISTIRQEAVPTDDGDVAARRVISFPLSFDHRTVDGADAAHTLGTLVEHVESPWPFVIATGGRRKNWGPNWSVRPVRVGTVDPLGSGAPIIGRPFEDRLNVDQLQAIAYQVEADDPVSHFALALAVDAYHPTVHLERVALAIVEDVVSGYVDR